MENNKVIAKKYRYISSSQNCQEKETNQLCPKKYGSVQLAVSVLWELLFSDFFDVFTD